MMVDILIRERDSDRGFFVPWLPDEIEHSTGGTLTATYDILNRGTVEIPTGTGLREVSWSSVFPGINREAPGIIKGTRHPPAWYQQILDDWRRNGTVLLLMVYCYPINLNVIVEDFTTKATGAFGDLEYTVKFKEKRDITPWLVTPAEDVNTEPQRSAVQGTSYTVVKGDSLWKIAKKTLGTGARWQEIFYANQAVLEEWAKKYHSTCTLNHPIIYAGQVLTIPAA